MDDWLVEAALWVSWAYQGNTEAGWLFMETFHVLDGNLYCVGMVVLGRDQYIYILSHLILLAKWHATAYAYAFWLKEEKGRSVI